MQRVEPAFFGELRGIDEEELGFRYDRILARLAGETGLRPEQRAFIREQVNNPSRIGYALVLDWGRALLPPAELDILAAMKERRRQHGPAARPAADLPRRPAPRRGAEAGTAWAARQAEIDAAVARDGRTARKSAEAALERKLRDYSNEAATFGGLAIAIVLTVLGFCLIDILREEASFEDCVLQGRHNCLPVGERTR